MRPVFLQFTDPAAAYESAFLVNTRRACFNVGPYGDHGPTGSCFFFQKWGSLCAEEQQEKKLVTDYMYTYMREAWVSLQKVTFRKFAVSDEADS